MFEPLLTISLIQQNLHCQLIIIFLRSITTSVGVTVASVEGMIPTQSKPRGAQLKRAGSADTGGANVVTGGTSPRAAAHALLCRTGSQDNPHVEGPINQGSSIGVVSSSATSPLTKSLPRI